MKLVNKISIVICSFLTFLVLLYSGLTSSGFDGNVMIPIVYFLFLLPLSNIFRSKKKYINNIIYHILLYSFCFFNIYIYILAFSMYFKIGTNESTLFISHYFIINFILSFLLFIISFIFKKEEHEIKTNFNLNYLFLTITASFHLLSDTSLINIINTLIPCYLILSHNNILEREKLQKIYILMIIVSLVSFNFISTILIIKMYISLDKERLY